MLSSCLLSFLTLGSAPSLGLERYAIDPRTSTVGFDGTSALHDFTGRTHAITGDLRADRADPGRLVGGAVWIEARTIDTDNRSRDGEIRDLLDVQRYPQIVFRLDSVQGTLRDGAGEFQARGRFTIKGVEKPRVVGFHIDPLPATTDASGRGLRVQGELRFKMTDHGIERPGVLFAKVADEVRVWLDLTLRPVPDEGIDARVRTVQVEEEFAPSAPGGSPRRVSGTERVWTTASNRLWERELEPLWALSGDNGLTAIDPRTGGSQPPVELLRQAMEQLSKPAIAGTTWTSSADAGDGRRTIRITFEDEVPARLPAWALDPGSWANGPASSSSRGRLSNLGHP